MRLGAARFGFVRFGSPIFGPVYRVTALLARARDSALVSKAVIRNLVARGVQ